jgi:hypothetical protein
VIFLFLFFIQICKNFKKPVFHFVIMGYCV